MAIAFKCKKCEKLFPTIEEAREHLCKPEMITVWIKDSEFCERFSHDWRVDSFKKVSEETHETHANPNWDGPGGYEPQDLHFAGTVSVSVYEIKAVCNYCGDTKDVKKEGDFIPRVRDKIQL